MQMWFQIVGAEMNAEGQGLCSLEHSVLMAAFLLCWNEMEVGFEKKGQASPVYFAFYESSFSAVGY